jgi:O-antigen/teichoic acid export membrane protein
MKMSSSPLLISGTTLAVSVMAANVVNLFFNAYLGRVVSPEDFGVLALINTFMYFGSLFYNAIGGITNREVAFLDSGVASQAGTVFFLSLSKQIVIVNLILAVIWTLFVPLTSQFFHLSDTSIFYLFTPLFILYPLAFLGRGYLQGKLLFVLAGVTIFIEPVIKLLSAFLLLSAGAHQLIYLSIYISAIVTGVVTFLLAWKKRAPVTQKSVYAFPLPFFGAALLAGISTISFLALDMILVKHFLSPEQAGQYAYLSLLGKIVFFAGSLLNVFTISLVSREAQHKKNPSVTFYLLLLGSAAMALGAVLVFGLLGFFSIPLLFTQKASQIIPLATPYLFAMALFTLGNTIVTYHLALKQYLFAILSIVMSGALIGGILYSHQSLGNIVNVLLTVSIFYSLTLAFFHIQKNFFSPSVSTDALQNISKEVLS